jgi:hypothetical protein
MAFWLTLIAFIALFTLIYLVIDAYPKIKLNIQTAPEVLPIIGHLHKVIGLDTEGKDWLQIFIFIFFCERSIEVTSSLKITHFITLSMS